MLKHKWSAFNKRQLFYTVCGAYLTRLNYNSSSSNNSNTLPVWWLRSFDYAVRWSTSIRYFFFMCRRYALNRQIMILIVSSPINTYIPKTSFSLMSNWLWVSSASYIIMLLFSCPLVSMDLVSFDSSDEPKISILQISMKIYAKSKNWFFVFERWSTTNEN